ncbi:GGDEF domain-containing protein [Allostreptomyces psammosilenae]|uniref:Diguanylate cyclase (GGDEF)-like protein n=1 Tax=Allostreptomyces psammosilenae TaxID=1892865 RepID=A0A853ABA8_9ACTN|nr:GGDEF domain-containing protein [Allostreptomyces psammosilenae]NYI07778.1 diguanylate cyclase (GGDEF)-like protein [Allostreptomyces psammosilenae]
MSLITDHLTVVLGALLLVTALVMVALLLTLRALRISTAERVAELRRRVTRLECECSELTKTSVTDPLTGVWNYRYLQLSLDREVERSNRTGRPLAVLLLDIDRFEQVNRAGGHQRGNAALRDLAQRLALEVRQTDTLGRYGGEEFVVLLPDTDAEGAAHVAERLCWTVRRHRIEASFPVGQPARRPVEQAGTPSRRASDRDRRDASGPDAPAATAAPAGAAAGATTGAAAGATTGAAAGATAGAMTGAAGGTADAAAVRAAPTPPATEVDRIASGARVSLTASIGVAVLPDHANHAATLLRAADQALAEAKAAGGNGWREAVRPPEYATGGEPDGDVRHSAESL